MKYKNGFTLVELVIVMVVIMILAVIAVPNYLRARLSANETSVIGALKGIHAAETQYKTSAFMDADNDGISEYVKLATLTSPPAGPEFIDEVLGAGTKSGYNFTWGATNPETDYWVRAEPVVYGKTGIRSFIIDQSGVIRAGSVGGAPIDTTYSSG